MADQSTAAAISPDGASVAFRKTECDFGWIDPSTVYLREDVDGPVPPSFYRVLNEGPLAAPEVFYDHAIRWSRNGRFVLFDGKEEGYLHKQVFVHDLLANAGVAVSRSGTGELADDNASAGDISGDGSSVIFVSAATNLGTDGGQVNLFARERPAFASTGDSDDLPDALEDGAPNGGDGNDDGIRDALQSNVASFPSAGLGSPYTTLESPAGTELKAVGADPTPTGGPSLSTPLGSFTFEVHGIGVGDTVTMNYYMPAGTGVTTLYKHDGATWTEFDPAPDGTGAVVAGDVIEITLEDGGRGDDDGVADGKIVDPAIPASELADIVSVTLSGGVSYANSAPLTSGNVEVNPATGAINSVVGSATIPSAVSGSATVFFGARQFWILPVFVGKIVVQDTAAGIYTPTPLLFRPVSRGAGNSAYGTANWFTFSGGRFATYTLSWNVVDGD